jgi:hypothetical protein
LTACSRDRCHPRYPFHATITSLLLLLALPRRPIATATAHFRARLIASRLWLSLARPRRTRRARGGHRPRVRAKARFKVGADGPGARQVDALLFLVKVLFCFV